MSVLEIRPKNECRWDLVSLGEIMLRLDPGESRVRTTRSFQVWEGGGEYNVARGLRRCFGMRTAVVTAFADNEVEGLDELPDAPPPPPPLVSGQPMDLDDELAPEIRIIRHTEQTVEEYRFNGKLYMVQITPKFGPSYFLRDTDGDGKMETRLSSIYSDMVVPQWVLFSWD